MDDFEEFKLSLRKDFDGVCDVLVQNKYTKYEKVCKSFSKFFD